MIKPKIIKPLNDGHCGDTFRELVDLWNEAGYIDLEYKNVGNCWFNSINDILLYDKPTLQWLNPLNDKYNHALFGNPEPSLPNTYPWIFWGRRPRLMEDVIKYNGIKSYDERSIESIFLGKVENDVQLGRRTNIDWTNSTSIFEMPIRGEYKYSQKEYLELVSNSRYGLCLAGYGKKCNREIELMSMGVIPIITEGVDITYYNPLIEGIHYLRVNTPQDIPILINSISKQKWEYMSRAILQWYEENCSIKGSFDTTMKIIKGLNI